MADRTISVDLIGHDRSLSTSLDKSGRAAQKNSKLLGAVGKVAGGAMKVGLGVAAVGVAGLTKWVVDGVKSATSYQTVLKKTAAVIKSTGNAAHISVKSVKDMAANLETMSGVDEELIINSQNVLATFTGIKNVGKDKIFDQATKSALDMSVALGSDLQGASIQVGKALNDPIKGITALSRVGVSFTEQQKKQIAQMVKVGDTVGAQKLILAELNKEFGGAAKAAGSGFAGSMDRAKDALSDAGRAVGQALLPKLTILVDKFTKALPAAIETAKGAWKRFVDGFNGAKLDGGLSSFGASLKTIQQQLDATKDGFDGTSEATWDWKAALSSIPAYLGFIVAGSIAMFNHVKNGVQEFGLSIQKTGQTAALKFDEAMGHLPGKVGKHFRDLAAEGRRNLDDVQAKLNRVNVNQLKQQIADAKLNLAVLGRQKPTPKIRADIAQLKAKIAQAQEKLRSLHDVNLSVTTTFYQVGKGPGTKGQGLGVLARAGGGPVAKGQPYVVGENRPELFVPNQSGTIIPKVPTSGRSGAAWSGGGGGGTTVNVYVTQPLGTPSQIADAVSTAFRRSPAGGPKLPRSAMA